MNVSNCVASVRHLFAPTADCVTIVGLASVFGAGGPAIVHSCSGFSGPGLWSIGAGAGAGCLLSIGVFACGRYDLAERRITLAPDSDSASGTVSQKNVPVTSQPVEKSFSQTVHSDFESKFSVHNDSRSQFLERYSPEPDWKHHSEIEMVEFPYPDVPPPEYSKVTEIPPAFNPDYTLDN